MNFKFFKNNENNNQSDVINNKNRLKKLYFTGYEELNISTDVEEMSKKVDELAYNIMLKYKNKPNLILQLMESKGTKIVISPVLKFILLFFCYEEGFIPKQTGLKAGLFNFIVQLLTKETPNFALEHPDVLVASKKNLSLYFLAQHFHHWLAYQNKLPGYEQESLEIFRHTFNNPNANLSILSINQVIALKDTIERDRCALAFVQKFVREQVGAKERLNSILNGDKTCI